MGIRHRSGPFFYIANGRRSRASFIERKAIETNRQALRGNEEVTMNQDYNAYASCPAGKPGAKEDISGASFMLAPMTDRYEEVIMGAVRKMDTSRVWINTSKMGTVCRGRRDDVFDCVKACFAYAYQPDVHMTLTLTLSKGCPGDCDVDYVLAEEGTPANEEGTKDLHFPVDVKFALYSLGDGDYMPEISQIIALADEMHVFRKMMHYATVLQGDVQDIFAYFNKAFRHCEDTMSHFVMEITMSVNSPSADD